MGPGIALLAVAIAVLIILSIPLRRKP